MLGSDTERDKSILKYRQKIGKLAQEKKLQRETKGEREREIIIIRGAEEGK